jgi:hypothetical protein
MIAKDNRDRNHQDRVERFNHTIAGTGKKASEEVTHAA